jgi:hypothetical protein
VRLLLSPEASCGACRAPPGLARLHRDSAPKALDRTPTGAVTKRDLMRLQGLMAPVIVAFVELVREIVR